MIFPLLEFEIIPYRLSRSLQLLRDQLGSAQNVKKSKTSPMKYSGKSDSFRKTKKKICRDKKFGMRKNFIMRKDFVTRKSFVTTKSFVS